MASIITATTTSGLTQSADNSGVLQLASGSGNLVTVPSVTGTAMVSGNMPAFYAGRITSDQSISSSTWTKVQLNYEAFDTANAFDSTTNYRFTPQVAGYYQINGQITCSGAASLTRAIVSLYKNGSPYSTGVDIAATANNSQFQVVVANLVYLNGSTDYVELYGFIVATSPIFAYAGISGVGTYMSGCLLRSA